MAESTITPVRVRIYGLFRMTRRTYLVLQSIVLSLATGCLIVGLLTVPGIGRWRFFELPPIPVPPGWWGQQALIGCFWVGALALPLELIELFVVLARFKRAEAAQRTSQPADVSPLVPPSAASQAIQQSPGVQTGK